MVTLTKESVVNFPILYRYAFKPKDLSLFSIMDKNPSLNLKEKYKLQNKISLIEEQTDAWVVFDWDK